MIDRVQAEVRRATGQLRARVVATQKSETQYQKPQESNMQYESYKAITATPETQAEFLRLTRESYESNSKAGEALHEFMGNNIQVGGKPFSQVKHLTALEDDSYDWDFQATSTDVKKALIADATALHELDQGYDLPHFITGYEAMAQDFQPEPPAAIDHQSPVKPPSPDDMVDAGAPQS